MTEATPACVGVFEALCHYDSTRSPVRQARLVIFAEVFHYLSRIMGYVKFRNQTINRRRPYDPLLNCARSASTR